MSWLHCGEDDDEGSCEAGLKLGLVEGGADGCLCAYTADSGAQWFYVRLLGASEAVRGAGLFTVVWVWRAVSD